MNRLALSCCGLFLWSCASEEAIKIYNNDPEATITSHSSGAELIEGVSYTFTGQVTDANHQNTELKVVWSTNNGEICAENVPDASGGTSCQAVLSTNDSEIRLQVTDPEGAATLDTITISVQETEAPSIQLLAPVSGGTYYSDQLIHFAAIITDAEDEASDLSYSWSSSIDGTLPLTGVPDTDGSMEGYYPLSEGQHAISLRVEDTSGKTKTETVAIVVGGANSEPLCSITEPLADSTHVLGQSISFSAMTTDADINNALLSVSWSSNIDGEFESNPPLTDGTLGFSTNQLSAGNHSIVLRVEDEVGGLCSTGVQIAIGTPPSISLTSPASGSVYSLGDAVVFSGNVVDQEDLASDVSLAWTSSIDGLFSSQGSDTSGSIVLSTTSLSPGLHTISVVATDSIGLSDSTSVSIQINNPPTISGTMISGGAYNTDTLTCSAVATDLDETVSAQYSWSIGSVTVGTGDTLNLSTTTALPLDIVVCTASVTDSEGAFASESTNLTLLNRVPSTPEIEVTPLEPVEGEDDLICSISTPSTDDDGQSVSYSFAWTKDGVATSYSTDTILAADLGAAETWTCMVTPNDGMDAGGVASDSVTILSSGMGFLTECDESLDVGGGFGIDFVHVTAGTFLMGSPASELGRSTSEDLHQVTLTQDFLVATTEITQGIFFQVMGYHAHDNRNTSDATGSFGVGDNYPAYYISWNLGAYFSNTITQLYNALHSVSLQECYTCTTTSTSVSCSTAIEPIYQCTGYRMLTEAEWEYAARAGTTESFWTSNGGGDLPNGFSSSTSILSDGFDLSTYAWYLANNSSYGSKEVASLAPNDNGIYDMSGNVWEWTHDNYLSSLGTDSVIDPVRDTGTNRSFRGGYWNSNVDSVRSARRLNYPPHSISSSLGLRVGRSDNAGKPSAPDVSISPATALAGEDDLICVIDSPSVDPDGNTVQYSFSWTVDGVAYTGLPSTTTYNGDTIIGSETSVGEVWECTVMPNDGVEDGYTDSANITIVTPVELKDCTGTVSGYYCSACVSAGNDGSACKSSTSLSTGICGSCLLNACLHSPNYSTVYNQSCY